MPPVAEPIPMTLSTYRIVTAAATALAPRLLERRLARGKENPDRVAERRGEPSAPRLPGAFHQFIPLDVPAFIARFLDYWHPELALFVESDLWPNTILAASERQIP